jgi:hypothetical protein
MTQLSEPLVSAVLPTDCLETIAPVLARLRRLESAERIEVILVSHDAESLRSALAFESGFHAIVVCQVDTLAPLGAARAAGVVASSAPYVFLGETHSYLWPDSLGPLLTPLVRGEADLTVPGFVNGNPIGSFSWACFLVAYSRWGDLLDPDAIVECPAYDFLARRDVLVAMGDRLGSALSAGNVLNDMLRAGHHRVLFVPGARIDHVNLEAAWPCLYEHYLIGVSIGAERAKRWSALRRIAHIAGSCLVPAVLMARTWHGVCRLLATERVPALALPTMLLLFAAKAIGEVIGYAGLANSAHQERQTHYEIRRLDYASPCLPR